jgi:L-arabinonolactonase
MTVVDCMLDCKARIGEGVLWDDRDQAVWWVDIEAPTLNRFDPATGQNRAWTMPSRIGCFAPREAGGFIVALEDGFHFFEPEAGTFSHIHDPEVDKPNNRMNDGAVDLRGRLVAGTMCMGPRDPVGAIHRLGTDLKVDTLFTGLRVSNGAAFSPDGRIFYFSDSDPAVRTIWTCDYDPDGTAVTNRRVFADTKGLPGRPDGAAVDAEGRYWMAGVGGWQLVCFTPDGKVDRTIDVPIEKPTKLTFGGPNLDTIYVTSIGRGMEGDERQPQAGGLFALHVPGVQGLPTWRFGA